VTTVFVTHDQEEALDLADRVAILKSGELVQLGKPSELYEAPANPFVYDFLGAACRLPGEVTDGRLRVADWELAAPKGSPQGAVEVFFRPDEVAFAPADGAGLAAEVRAAAARGPKVRVDVVVAGRLMELEVHSRDAPAGVEPGQALRIELLRPQVYRAA